MPRGYFPQERSPAYPFFRKEKIHPYVRRRDYDAEAPSVSCYTRGFLQGEALCYARRIYPQSARNRKRDSTTLILSAGRGLVRRTESSSQGYRLAAASLPCPRRSEGTYERGDRRCSEGAAVVEGFPWKQKSPHPHIPIGSTISVCAETPVRRRKYPAGRRELFSLRKKRTAGIRLSAWQE